MLWLLWGFCNVDAVKFTFIPSASLPSDSWHCTEEKLAVREFLWVRLHYSSLLLLKVGYICVHRLGMGNLLLIFFFKIIFPSF